MNNDYDFLYKLLLIGDTVGKTSLVMRFVYNMFKEGSITNLDSDFIFHTVVVDGKRIKLQLWDYKQGEERFRRFPFSDYRLSHGLFIVYDITNVESFNDLKIWLGEITKHGGENVNKLLVGNKFDLDSQRAVTFEQGQEFARSMGMEYIETSAKNATNVDEAFTILITQIKERMKSELVFEESRGVRLTAASGGKGKNHCVCC